MDAELRRYARWENVTLESLQPNTREAPTVRRWVAALVAVVAARR